MSVKDAIEWRKTVKIYDDSKVISAEELATIIEAGRMAPSSMGLEVCNIVVIKNKEIKAKFAYDVLNGSNVEKGLKCDTLVCLVGYNANYLVSDEFLRSRLHRSEALDEKKLSETIEKYRQYLENHDNLTSYVDSQVYITTAFMTLQAADLKIGTTIIGGFNDHHSNDLLHELGYIDKDIKHTVLLLALGKYDEKTTGATFARKRISTEEFAKIVK
ncbi:nitroreductase family protein [Spiroplasma eriocheiris]|uniref:Nitroreductase n=1 Tax=Spiroplasma eriocheiris TaxID=315358 RepID=A0A0H3XLK4_9MOLU|nr:nitroreductase family protein [Spiroplasma eriocheiris]AHF57195.1 putative NADPH nitroreductase oxidoreductase [Spiroplasma eriocheiris CCTCC M 207170]AKM53662.1 nitroreductase [Spiroplasma eriocheiris]